MQSKCEHGEISIHAPREGSDLVTVQRRAFL